MNPEPPPLPSDMKFDPKLSINTEDESPVKQRKRRVAKTTSSRIHRIGRAILLGAAALWLFGSPVAYYSGSRDAHRGLKNVGTEEFPTYIVNNSTIDGSEMNSREVAFGMAMVFGWSFLCITSGVFGGVMMICFSPKQQA